MKFLVIKLIILGFLFNPDLIKGQGFPIYKGFDLTEFDASQQAWDLAQDTNGVLYISHASGILRYDGLNWETIHGASSNHVHRLFEGSNGQIFYGSESSFGYLEPDSINKFRFKELSNLLPEGSIIGDIYDIHELNNEIYFTTSSGFLVWDYSELRIIPSYFQISRSFGLENEIVIHRSGGGLYTFKEGRFDELNGTEIFSDDYVYMLFDKGNIKLIGSRKRGFLKLQAGVLSTIKTSKELGLERMAPYRVEKLSDDNVAIATLNNGVIIVNEVGDFIDSYNYSTEMKSSSVVRNNMILGLMEDNDLQLWVATVDGINKIGRSIPAIQLNNYSGLDDGIRTLQRINDTIYVGTQNGLFKSSNQSDIKQIRFVKESNTNVKKLTLYKDILVAVISNGVITMKEGEESTIFSSPSVEDILVVDDDLFILERNHLLYVDFSKSDNVIETNIRGNFLRFYNFNETLWIEDGDEGIRSIEIGSLTESQISKNDIPKTADVNFIGTLFDTLRFGTEEGLFKYFPETNSIIRDSSFSDKSISQKQVFMFQGIDENSVWFWNDRKMRVFERKQDKWVGKEDVYNALNLSTPPMDVTFDNSNMWIANSRYITLLSNLSWRYDFGFKTNITDIFVNRDSLIYGGFGEPVKPIVLPYEDNEVRFNYAAASYIDVARNTYSYKLEGFDTDWSEWSYETQKDYTNIPEGDYIFKIRSRNVFEVDGTPDQIEFTVLPPWYRTWWAYMLYFISFSGLLYTGYKIRVNQLLKVERMRTKIASDLHDEVSATLTGISYFAEAIKRDKDESKSAHFISLITESAGDAKEKITDIVWSINPENDSWELFLSKCRRFASDLLESKNLKYTLNITEQIPGKLTMEVRQHLWMIFKEMITNAVRHSNATRLDVIMDVEDGLLKLIVQDNGIGFDPDEIQDGNGVRNIRKRANNVGAKIKIHSEVEFGTRWRMELPL